MSRLIQDPVRDIATAAAKNGLRLLGYAGAQIVKRMQDYPPERPGQKYKRTFRFKRSWNLAFVSDGLLIENLTPYAGRVVGDEFGKNQAWMHVGRWSLFRSVVEQEIASLPESLSDLVSFAKAPRRL